MRMASGNEGWGYTRIVGELSNLGHRVSRSTVRRILKERGIGPAPERLPHLPWSKFRKAHWEAIAAADFFTVEVWPSIGLVRYLVSFVINLSTRRMEIAGIVPVPNGLWMRQVARNLIDDLSGFLKGERSLIHDRDPLYTHGFHKVLAYGGLSPVRLPRKSPNLNAYAEGFVLSMKQSASTGWSCSANGTCGERSPTTWIIITWSGVTKASASRRSEGVTWIGDNIYIPCHKAHPTA